MKAYVIIEMKLTNSGRPHSANGHSYHAPPPHTFLYGFSMQVLNAWPRTWIGKDPIKLQGLWKLSLAGFSTSWGKAYINFVLQNAVPTSYFLFQIQEDDSMLLLLFRNSPQAEGTHLCTTLVCAITPPQDQVCVFLCWCKQCENIYEENIYRLTSYHGHDSLHLLLKRD